jgi:hypothetical protein
LTEAQVVGALQAPDCPAALAAIDRVFAAQTCSGPGAGGACSLSSGAGATTTVGILLALVAARVARGRRA